MNKKRGENILIFLLIFILIVSAIYFNNLSGKAIRKQTYLTIDGNLCNNLNSYQTLSYRDQSNILSLVKSSNNPNNLCSKTSVTSEFLGGNNCLADIANNDGIVDVGDLAILLGAWGPNPGHPADITGDGDVDADDLALLLGAWGPCGGEPLQMTGGDKATIKQTITSSSLGKTGYSQLIRDPNIKQFGLPR